MALEAIAKTTTQITSIVRIPLNLPIIAPTNEPVENRGIQTKRAIPGSPHLSILDRCFSAVSLVELITFPINFNSIKCS